MSNDIVLTNFYSMLVNNLCKRGNKERAFVKVNKALTFIKINLLLRKSFVLRKFLFFINLKSKNQSSVYSYNTKYFNFVNFNTLLIRKIIRRRKSKRYLIFFFFKEIMIKKKKIKKKINFTAKFNKSIKILKLKRSKLLQLKKVYYFFNRSLILHQKVYNPLYKLVYFFKILKFLTISTIVNFIKNSLFFLIFNFQSIRYNFFISKSRFFFSFLFNSFFFKSLSKKKLIKKLNKKLKKKKKKKLTKKMIKKINKKIISKKKIIKFWKNSAYKMFDWRFFFKILDLGYNSKKILLLKRNYRKKYKIKYKNKYRKYYKYKNNRKEKKRYQDYKKRIQYLYCFKNKKNNKKIKILSLLKFIKKEQDKNKELNKNQKKLTKIKRKKNIFIKQKKKIYKFFKNKIKKKKSIKVIVRSFKNQKFKKRYLNNILGVFYLVNLKNYFINLKYRFKLVRRYINYSRYRYMNYKYKYRNKYRYKYRNYYNKFKKIRHKSKKILNKKKNAVNIFFKFLILNLNDLRLLKFKLKKKLYLKFKKNFSFNKFLKTDIYKIKNKYFKERKKQDFSALLIDRYNSFFNFSERIENENKLFLSSYFISPILLFNIFLSRYRINFNLRLIKFGGKFQYIPTMIHFLKDIRMTLRNFLKIINKNYETLEKIVISIYYSFLNVFSGYSFLSKVKKKFYLNFSKNKIYMSFLIRRKAKRNTFVVRTRGRRRKRIKRT